MNVSTKFVAALALAAVLMTFGIAANAGDAAGVSPTSIDFGNLAVGTTATRDVTYTIDDGYSFVSVSNVGIGDVPFAVDVGTCTTGATGSCLAHESFNPTAPGGVAAVLRMQECPTAGGVCITTDNTVQGTGITVAAASPSSVDFGNVALGTTATRDVTLTVDAGYSIGAATGEGISVPFSFDPGTCATAAGTGPGSCVVHESFSPTAPGTATGTLNVPECPTAGGACVGIPVSLQGIGFRGLANLSLAIGATPNPAQLNKPVVILITVRNLGPTAAAGIVVTDTLPTVSKILSVNSAQGSCNAPPAGSTGTITCGLGSLASGAATTVQVTVELVVKKGLVDDTASVTNNGNTTDPSPSDNSATVSIRIK